jgi:hypothetical protein
MWAMPQDGVRTFLPLLRLAAQQPVITRPARYVHYTYALRNPVLLSDIVTCVFREIFPLRDIARDAPRALTCWVTAPQSSSDAFLDSPAAMARSALEEY